jgi:hypothetical protein
VLLGRALAEYRSVGSSKASRAGDTRAAQTAAPVYVAAEVLLVPARSGPVRRLTASRSPRAQNGVVVDEGERAKIIAVVSPACASSTRGTLDLLTLRWPFSQVQLLSAEELCNHAGERRIDMLGDRTLDLSGLEELHRTGVLVPFYRVRLDNGDPDQTIDLSESRTLRLVPGTITNELFRGAHEGRVTDPAAEPYEPWPTEQLRMLWPSNDWAFVYSYHQLLGLRRARTIVGMLHPRHHKDHRTTWHLAEEDLPEEQALTNCASWREKLSIPVDRVAATVLCFVPAPPPGRLGAGPTCELVGS